MVDLPDHRVNIKERREKNPKKLDLNSELIEQWNVMVIPIVVGIQWTVLKNQEKKLVELKWERIETNQNADLRSKIKNTLV